jgi:hypothetical protein
MAALVNVMYVKLSDFAFPGHATPHLRHHNEETLVLVSSHKSLIHDRSLSQVRLLLHY